MMDASHWIGRIFAWRMKLVVTFAVLTLLSVLGASRVGVDNAVEIWFPDNDPALTAYHGFLDTFGNDEVVVIGVHSEQGSLLNADGLARIKRVGEAALSVPGVAGIRSVAVQPLISGQDATVEVAAAKNAEALVALQGTDPTVDSFVSTDQQTALVLAEMAKMSDIDSRRDGILRQLRSAISTVEQGASFAGIGVVYAALNEASTQGAAAIIGASYVLILVLLWVLLGRWKPTILTLVVVGLGAIWLMGLYGATGHNINMVTMVMPTLVLVIGVSDCVHMLTHVAAQPAELDPIERVKAGVGAVFWPCLFNTITTAMGFLALASAGMPVIRELGVFCAIGLVAAFFASVILCTLVAVRPGFLPVIRTQGRLQRVVDGLADISIVHAVPVLLISLFVALFAAHGVTRIVVDTYSIDFLYPDHEARVDSDRLESGFGPYTPLEFVVSHPEGVKQQAVLRGIAEWQEAMEVDYQVGWTRSLADVVQRLDQVLSGRSVSTIPADDRSIEQLLFLYEADADSDLPQFLDSTETRTRVTVGVRMTSAQGFGEAISRLTSLAKLPAGTTVQPAGYIPLYVRIMDQIVATQLSSFAWAFGVIFVLIGVLFRSVRIAILAVPANLLPVLITLGVMGYVGIRLDVATVTISAIVLGLVVDDTTQFLYRYRAVQQSGLETADAVRQAVQTVGRPMMITTLVLAGGFSVLGLAAIKSVAYFGILLAVALLSALLSDLLVIPALLVVLARR